MTGAPRAAAFIACALLAGLAVFQAALIFGAPLGRFAWGGGADVLSTPLRIGSAVSIALYAVFSVVVLERAGVTRRLGRPRAVRIAAWVLAVYFCVGVLMNAISRSEPERLVMTPVAIVLALCCIVVARGDPRLRNPGESAEL